VAGRDIGFLYALTGKLEEAEVSLRLAERELHHADLPSHHAVALANLGFVLRQQGKTDEAVRTLRWAASVAADHGTAYSQAYTTRALATALLAAGEVTQAQQHARQAAAAFTDLGDHIGAAQSLRVLGEGLGRAANGSEQALPVLDQALTLFRDHGFTWGVALTELTIGEILARHHEPGALHLLQRSLAYWTREQVPALRARTLHALQNVPGGSEHAGAQGTQAR
jgi:tetratricopeptide (TPR) repeat protein